MQNVILVVEDDPAVLEGISISLTQSGYLTVNASNGAEGLDQLQEVKPDLILSDIMMPVMDGFDFYRALRSDPAWQLIPFVFITAKGQPHEIREGKRLGVDDYLVKPFEVEDVLAAIESKLQRARTIHEATQKEFQLLKERIVKLLSFELRGPLTSITGYSEMVVENADHLDPQTLAEFLAGIRKGADQLTRFVDDMLLLLAIEGGMAEEQYNRRKIQLESPQEFIKDVVTNFEAEATTMGVTLHIETSSLPPVEAEEEYLRIILSQLLDKALKSSRSGGKVDIGTFSRDNTLHITISNQGNNIPPEEIPFTFDVFQQLDQESYEEMTTGLGLTIAQELVRLHGGWIKVKNHADGSTFSVVFPIAR